MLYVPIHKRSGKCYTPVTEERKEEMQKNKVTSDTFIFELVDAEENTAVKPKQDTSNLKRKKKPTDEQSIDSGAGSEPLQQD